MSRGFGSIREGILLTSIAAEIAKFDLEGVERLGWVAGLYGLLYESSESAEKVDGYSDKLLKYIPADVVSFWLAGNGLVQSQAGEARVGALWLLFIIGFVLTALWTRKLTSEPGHANSMAANYSILRLVFCLGVCNWRAIF